MIINRDSPLEDAKEELIPGETTTTNEHHKLSYTLVVQLCALGFFMNFQPSESYLSEYLEATKHFSDAEIDNSIWPYDTYGSLISLLPIGLFAEHFGFRIVIFFGLLCRECTRLLLLYGTELWHMSLMQFSYAMSISVNWIYFAYIYMVIIQSSQYQIVTSYVQSSLLLGTFLSSLLAQILVSYTEFANDYTSLFYLSWISTSLALLSFFILPKPNRASPVSIFKIIKDSGFRSMFKHIHNMYIEPSGIVLMWSIWWVGAYGAYSIYSNYYQNQFIEYNKNDGDAYYGFINAIMELTSVIASLIPAFHAWRHRNNVDKYSSYKIWTVYSFEIILISSILSAAIISDTTSPTDDDESDSENENDSDSNENAVNDRLQYQATQPFLYHGSSTMNAPFLNVLSPISHSQSGAPPHLPFSIPLTPTNHAIATNTRDTHQFPPPPPLPLPYPDLNHLNNTQFSLAPIVSSVGMNDNDKIQNNEDKKNIIMTEKSNKNGDNSVLPSFIMRQQTQPLSFPPLPTNSHMNDNNNNMNHLNSNFAANMNDDLNETMLTACAERERDDSTDHDMDVALGTINHHHDTMPIIQNNNDINPTYYHNITPFDQPHNISVAKKRKARKTRTRHKISPKKSTKRIRKHNNRRKVKATAIIDDCTSISSSNNYQNISVHVPALNKMRLSPSKIQHNGRIAITRTSKKRCNASATNIVNIPNLSDNEHAAAASNTNHSILNMRTDSSQEIDGQMEVAYSQQYPQVGFPYIFNSDGENGKKFTCKFMDAISIIDGTPGFCDRQFGQKCHWMRHCLEKHVPTEMSQRYQCRECNMKYAQNSSLKEHFAICHSGQPPSFKCPYCSGDITFTRWTSVLRHCRNQHPDQEEPQKQMRASLRVTNSSKHTSADREKTKNKRVRMRKKNKQNKNNNHNHNNHNNNNGADENTNNSNNSNNSNNCMMDLDDATFCTMPPLNIMPSVNMNISMNQMLSNNHHPAFVAGVAILPPDMHRNHNGNAIG